MGISLIKSIQNRVNKRLKNNRYSEVMEEFLMNTIGDLDDIVGKLEMMSKGYVWREFRTHLRINAVACVRAVMLQNVGEYMTAQEIVEICQKKFGNRRVKPSTVYGEYNSNKGDYGRRVAKEDYSPYTFSLRLSSFSEVWEKVFVDDEILAEATAA